MKASLLVMFLFALVPTFTRAHPDPGQRLLRTTTSTSPSLPVEADGTIAVFVTWGDIDNSPADDVYIEAHGYVVKDKAEKSIVLKMIRPGLYEATVPPGVFDVFVSEGISVPVCKRVLVSPGKTEHWNLKLENDYVFTEK